MFQFLRGVALIGAMMVILSACASDPKSDGSKEAMDAWSECVMYAVSQLDDGKTDPLSIAYGISPRCAVQYNKLTEIMVGQAWTENGQRFARQTWKDQEIKLITSAILTYRSADAQSKQRLFEKSRLHQQ
jgi:hypothetical protein